MLLFVGRALDTQLSEHEEIRLHRLRHPEFANETILFYSSWQKANQSIFELPFDRRVDCSLHILLCRKYGAVVLPTIARCYSDGTCNHNTDTERSFTFRVYDSSKFSEILEELKEKQPVLRRYGFSVQSVPEDDKEALVSPDGQKSLLDLSERKIL